MLMRAQGNLNPAPKSVNCWITVEGNRVAVCTAHRGFMNPSMIITKEFFDEIKKTMDWK